MNVRILKTVRISDEKVAIQAVVDGQICWQLVERPVSMEPEAKG